VIGVPVKVALDGLDALLSIMQMPKGYALRHLHD
ncbi:MAG: AIR carboxylase family protein, partial [Candidatus Thorarchaeota archaeon]|nr:AIR carboxylase family protein [Candidatus Thorarchaeota archaeon]